MSETEKKKGTVVFMPYATGSKSESVRPYLYENRDNTTPIFKEGDNPFENKALEEFDGQQVQVTGYSSNDKFVVETIEKSNTEAENND